MSIHINLWLKCGSLNTLFCLLCLGFSLNLYAQNLESLVKKGRNELKQENHTGALVHLNRALRLDQNHEEANYYAGICQLELHNYRAALDHLLKAGDAGGEQYYFHLAEAYHQTRQFPEALVTLKKIGDYKDQETHPLVNQLYDNVIHAKILTSHPRAAVVRNLGAKINSADREYNAVMTSDHRSILFTARRAESAAEAKDGLAYENIYRVSMNEQDEWLDPKTIEDHSDSRGHDATVQLFDNDRKMVVFYEGNLYLTELSGGEFSEKEPLSMINSNKTFESHCFINDTQDIIYFSSDRNDPGGNLDLFVVKKNSSGTWDEPRALDELNTPFDEDSPFVSEDGILYFSSRGGKSMGGYDIFYTTYNESKQYWRSPTNIGYPINSVADDTYFSIFGKLAYLSSSRADGYGSLDLYRIQLFDHVLIPGKVVNKANDQLVAAADIKITYNGNQLETTSDDEGGVELTVPIEKEFELEIRKDQQLLHRGSYFINVHLSNHEEKKYNLMVHVKPAAGKPVDLYPLEKERQQLVVRMKDIEDAGKSHFEQHHVDLEHALALPVNIAVEPSITMEPSMAVVEEKVDLNILSIYFDLDSYVIDDDARPSMDMVVQAMSSQPDLKLVIEAHADSRGSKSYNMKLTQRRAQSVLDYLVTQGIEESRLEARAYGETELLNKCDNCTEEKHRDNRRLTFQVAQNLENPGQLVLKNQ